MVRVLASYDTGHTHTGHTHTGHAHTGHAHTRHTHTGHTPTQDTPTMRVYTRVPIVMCVGFLPLCYDNRSQWVFVQYNFLHFNVFEGVAGFYGTHPWHW